MFCLPHCPAIGVQAIWWTGYNRCSSSMSSHFFLKEACGTANVLGSEQRQLRCSSGKRHLTRMQPHRLRSEYGKAAIAAYVQGWLGDAEACYSKDLKIRDDKSYIMSLLAVLTSGDPVAGHQIKELGGTFHENGYSIPQMQIRRKEKKR